MTTDSDDERENWILVKGSSILTHSNNSYFIETITPPPPRNKNKQTNQ